MSPGEPKLLRALGEANRDLEETPPIHKIQETVLSEHEVDHSLYAEEISIRKAEKKEKLIQQQKSREVNIIDFSTGMPFYVKETAAFKKFDACNKSLNHYI